MPIVETRCAVCKESIFKSPHANATCSECYNEIHLPCFARLVLVDGMREGCFACDSKDAVTDETVADLQKRVDKGMPVYYSTDEKVVRLEGFIKTELADIKAQLSKLLAK